MPPLPKDPKTRQRRNRPTTAAKLNSEHDVRAPSLPEEREWHAQTTAWWKDIWASPMAPEYLKADNHGLFALAILVDDFWTSESRKERRELMAEIRLQRVCFGLTPVDRRRLQWEVERIESKKKSSPKPTEEGGEDPRSLLRAVK